MSQDAIPEIIRSLCFDPTTGWVGATRFYRPCLDWDTSSLMVELVNEYLNTGDATKLHAFLETGYTTLVRRKGGGMVRVACVLTQKGKTLRDVVRRIPVLTPIEISKKAIKGCVENHSGHMHSIIREYPSPLQIAIASRLLLNIIEPIAESSPESKNAAELVDWIQVLCNGAASEAMRGYAAELEAQAKQQPTD